MIRKTQRDAFLKYEADNWFNRNKEALHLNIEHDMAIKLLQEYELQPTNVLEIGCSTGYRLSSILSVLPGTMVTGLDPSGDAIKFGKEKYPDVNFIKGTADDMSMIPSASFDLVIVGFVLYVVDREMLFKVIAETDRVMKDGGILMIIDFFSEKPSRNPYHHINDFQAYAYKQNYEDIFIASKLYHLLDKRSMNHQNKSYNATGDYYNKYSITTLRKDLSEAYR